MSYIDEVCDRCGSKRKVSKTWKEKLITSFGTSVLEVSRVTCKNVACQKEFDDKRQIERAQSLERKRNKEEQDALRRSNIALTIAKKQKTSAVK